MSNTTSLSIVKELRRLAQNPSHREYLLRNDVNSILIFVDPDEHPVEVVTEAMHALFCLAEEASESQVTRRSLKSTLGLMELMKKLEQREGYSIECKALAIKIQKLLTSGATRTPISSPSPVHRIVKDCEPIITQNTTMLKMTTEDKLIDKISNKPILRNKLWQCVFCFLLKGSSSGDQPSNTNKKKYNEQNNQILKIKLSLSKKRNNHLDQQKSVVTRAAGARSGQRALKFLGGNKKAKVITLEIEGLVDQEKRQLCVDELVRVKGVISLTFNMPLRRCIVRAKAELTPEALATAVKRTKVMEACQVVKNEAGDEVLLPLDSKVNDSYDKDLPPYLEEETHDTPQKEDHAVARPDSSFSSVAGSWFGSVLSAVNKNLYW